MFYNYDGQKLVWNCSILCKLIRFGIGNNEWSLATLIVDYIYMILI